MSIRDKLTRLDQQRSQPETPEPQPQDWVESLRRELQVSVIEKEKAFILLKENLYPVHEDAAFRVLREQGFAAPALRNLSADLPEAFANLRQGLFIDTETTGLAGGMGTYAFLLGIGFLELDHIVVKQYLLPDFGHESLMLELFAEQLSKFEYTVSFNGKSFDIPLLKNRFVLNRMLNVLDDVPHVDILHSARRIWRNRLPACDLQSLEQFVLGEDREGDIPGALIPHIYFEFIRKREALHLRDVLEHNYHDIVNMILLTMKIALICEAPLKHLHHPQDVHSLAWFYYQNGKIGEAVSLLRQFLDGVELPVNRQISLRRLLAMGYKKQKRYDEAIGEFERLIAMQCFQADVIEAYAIVLEHYRKDDAAAIAVVEKGLSYLDTLQALGKNSTAKADRLRLLHRRDRLSKRLANSRPAK